MLKTLSGEVCLHRRWPSAAFLLTGENRYFDPRVGGFTLTSSVRRPQPIAPAVSGRPGDDHCIYFNDPDGHRLQLVLRR
jgi:hypothetical protein